MVDKMQGRLDHMPETTTIRRQTIEHPLGTHNRAASLPARTLEKIKSQMSLEVLAYNMKRIINIFASTR